MSGMAKCIQIGCPNQRPILRARAPSFLSSFRVYAKCIWLDETNWYVCPNMGILFLTHNSADCCQIYFYILVTITPLDKHNYNTGRVSMQSRADSKVSDS